MREVNLGTTTDVDYEVLSGLNVNEEVVLTELLP